MTVRSGRTKILAVASGGGHWIQLMRLRAAIRDGQVVYVTTMASYRDQVADCRFYAVPDASRWNKMGLCRMAIRLFWVLLKERPDVVITTGAAPGYFSIRFGKLLGARTIWIDSMANVEELSLSGQNARRYADLWLTQWPHLSGENGPCFLGAVL